MGFDNSPSAVQNVNQDYQDYEDEPQDVDTRFSLCLGRRKRSPQELSDAGNNDLIGGDEEGTGEPIRYDERHATSLSATMRR